MGRVKSVIFLLLGAFLAIFLYENWLPAPVIKIFGKEILTVSVSLIIISCFILGFLTGSLSCLAWYRRRAHQTAGPSAPKEAPEAQKAKEQHQEEQHQE